MEAQVAQRGAVGPDRRLVVAVVVAAEQMHPRAEPVGLQAQALPMAQQAQMGLQVQEERAAPEVVVAAELQHQAVRLVPRGNRSARRRPEAQVPAAPGAQVEGELGHPILAAAPADGPLHREAVAETPQRQEQTTAQAQTVRRALRAAVVPHHQQEVPGAPEARAAEAAPEAHLAAHRTSPVGAELARRLGNRAGRNRDSARTEPVEPVEPVEPEEPGG